MSHDCQPSEHAQSLLHVAAELQEVSDKTQVEDRRRTIGHWIRRIIMSAEYIDEVRKNNRLLEIHMAELSDKVIALSKAAGVLQTQLTEAQKNQQPPGTVPITQAAADSVVARVNDDLTLNPDATVAPAP